MVKWTIQIYRMNCLLNNCISTPIRKWNHRLEENIHKTYVWQITGNKDTQWIPKLNNRKTNNPIKNGKNISEDTS